MMDTSGPPEVHELLDAWHLLPDGKLITTRSSWLLPVRDGAMSALLKVARTPDEAAGYRLMAWWDGHGAANVHRACAGALLLERSEGPQSLAQLAYGGSDDRACRIICRTAALLHAPRLTPPPQLHALDHWFQPLFDMAAANANLAPTARVARDLLGEQRDVGPLHGDLHHDNVLDFGDRGWLAIDPHGLLGERTFDYANIFTNPDLSDPTRPLATLPGTFERRLAVVTAEADLDAARLLRWIVAWTGLSAAWFMADGDDDGACIDLAINAIARNLLA